MHGSYKSSVQGRRRLVVYLDSSEVYDGLLKISILTDSCSVGIVKNQTGRKYIQDTKVTENP